VNLILTVLEKKLKRGQQSLYRNLASGGGGGAKVEGKKEKVGARRLSKTASQPKKKGCTQVGQIPLAELLGGVGLLVLGLFTVAEKGKQKGALDGKNHTS